MYRAGLFAIEDESTDVACLLLYGSQDFPGKLLASFFPPLPTHEKAAGVGNPWTTFSCLFLYDIHNFLAIVYSPRTHAPDCISSHIEHLAQVGQAAYATEAPSVQSQRRRLRARTHGQDSACGTISLASPTESYSTAIVEGGTDFSAQRARLHQLAFACGSISLGLPTTKR